MPKQTAPPIAACVFELDSSSPGRVQIFPAGRFDAPLGAMQGQGPWQMDAAAARALMARVTARKTPIHFDYHHASLEAAKKGVKAPAAGWLETSGLRWVEDAGLFGIGVEWTETAAAEIAAREFRFLSPVFPYDPATGRPLDLYSIALTNTPAIDGMDEILAAASAVFSTPSPEPMMDELFERLCYLLNLPMTTTPQEMAGQLDKLKAMLAQEAGPAAASLPELLAAKDAKIAALQAQAPDPARYAPVAALAAVQQELAALKAKDLARDIDALVQPALGDGRLLAAQEAWARDLGQTNLAALQQFIAMAQPIAALAGMQTQGRELGKTTPKSDAAAIAAAATKYQTEQAAAGIFVDDVAAVAHVTQGA